MAVAGGSAVRAINSLYLAETNALVKIERVVIPCRSAPNYHFPTMGEWIVDALPNEAPTNRRSVSYPHVHFARVRDPVVVGHHSPYVVPACDIHQSLDVYTRRVANLIPAEPLNFEWSCCAYGPVAHGARFPTAAACSTTAANATKMSEGCSHKAAPNATTVSNSAPNHNNSPRIRPSGLQESARIVQQIDAK